MRTRPIRGTQATAPDMGAGKPPLHPLRPTQRTSVTASGLADVFPELDAHDRGRRNSESKTNTLDHPSTPASGSPHPQQPRAANSR